MANGPPPPVSVFVQVDRIAIRLQLLVAGLVAPAELDHGREVRLRPDEGAGRIVGIDIAVIAQFASITHRRQLPALRRGMRHVLVAAPHARVQAGAQAGFGGAVPLALGIDAMHEDDDARRRRLHQASELAVIEQGRALALADDQVHLGIERIAAFGVFHGGPWTCLD